MGVGDGEQSGVKMISLDGEFMGWVRTMDKHVLLKRLEAGNKVIGFVSEGYISTWVKGGGDCVSGQVYFQDKTMMEQRRLDERRANDQEAMESLLKEREFETKEFGYYLDDIDIDNPDCYVKEGFSPVQKKKIPAKRTDEKLVFAKFRVLSSDALRADDKRDGSENGFSDMESSKAEPADQKGSWKIEQLRLRPHDRSLPDNKENVNTLVDDPIDPPSTTHQTPRSVLRGGNWKPLTPTTPSNNADCLREHANTPTMVVRGGNVREPLTPVFKRHRSAGKHDASFMEDENDEVPTTKPLVDGVKKRKLFESNTKRDDEACGNGRRRYFLD